MLSYAAGDMYLHSITGHIKASLRMFHEHDAVIDSMQPTRLRIRELTWGSACLLGTLPPPIWLSSGHHQGPPFYQQGPAYTTAMSIEMTLAARQQHYAASPKSRDKNIQGFCCNVVWALTHRWPQATQDN